MSELEDKYPDFFRLAKDLRPMKKDFNYAQTKAILLGEKPTYKDEDEDAIIADDVELYEANLITSRYSQRPCMQGGPCPCPTCARHKIVLDIDRDAALIPSSTPGHYHLLIDVNIDWVVYEYLLRALVMAGVIEQGYAQASIRRRYTAVRTPWERKGS